MSRFCFVSLLVCSPYVLNAQEPATSQPTSQPESLGEPSFVKAALSQPDTALKPMREEAPALRYKPGKGFVWRPKSDTKLSFDAYAQMGYVQDPDVVDRVLAEPTDKRPDAEFVVRRLRVSTSVEFKKKFRAKLLFDVAEFLPSDPSIIDEREEPLRALWLGGDLNEDLSVRVGYQSIPFGRQRTESSTELLLPNRSLITSKFTFERGLGVVFDGDALGDIIHYKAGVLTDIVLAQQHNTQPVMLATLRVEASPFGPLKGGEGSPNIESRPKASFGVGAVLPVESVNLMANPTLGADARLEFWRLSLQPELFWRQRQDGDLDPNFGFIPNGQSVGQRGGYAQLGFVVVEDYIQLATRVGAIDEDPQPTQRNIDDPQGIRTEKTVGINLFGWNSLTLQAMLSVQSEALAPSTLTPIQELWDRIVQGGSNEGIFLVQLQGVL